MCKHIFLFGPLIFILILILLVLVVFISDYKTWIDILLLTEKRRLRKIRKKLEEKERI